MLIALHINTDRRDKINSSSHCENAVRSGSTYQQIKAQRSTSMPLLVHAPSTALRSGREAAAFQQVQTHHAVIVSLGQPNRTSQLARRDVDQHPVSLAHSAEPVLRTRRLPQLGTACSLPSKPPSLGRLDPRPCHRGNRISPLFSPQRCALPLMNLAHGVEHRSSSHIVIHHLAKGLHAGSQAKQLEARRNLRQASIFSALVGMAVDVVGFFMALLSL